MKNDHKGRRLGTWAVVVAQLCVAVASNTSGQRIKCSHRQIFKHYLKWENKEKRDRDGPFKN